MMQETLQFLIMVETPLSGEELLNILANSFPGVIKRKSNSCDLRGNWIEIWNNDDADADLASDPNTGYLHYRWRIEATPIGDEGSESEQVRLAKEMTECLESQNCLCVICANFEHLL